MTLKFLLALVLILTLLACRNDDVFYASLQSELYGLDYITAVDSPVYGVRVCTFPDTEVTGANLLAALNRSGATPVEERGVDDFFRKAAQQNDHWNAVRDLMSQNVTGLRVYRVGGPQGELYVVGITRQRELIGVRVNVIEQQ